jgi:hypothetical protein
MTEPKRAPTPVYKTIVMTFHVEPPEGWRFDNQYSLESDLRERDLVCGVRFEIGLAAVDVSLDVDGLVSLRKFDEIDAMLATVKSHLVEK